MVLDLLPYRISLQSWKVHKEGKELSIAQGILAVYQRHCVHIFGVLLGMKPAHRYSNWQNKRNLQLYMGGHIKDCLYSITVGRESIMYTAPISSSIPLFYSHNFSNIIYLTEISKRSSLGQSDQSMWSCQPTVLGVNGPWVSGEIRPVSAH